LKTNIK
jgi:hypothetical protein